jgi:pSer/pThr/pTyr-binding forkhead associated (FHA) protein
MDAILLTYRDESLRLFPLSEQPLEVGSGAGVDIVVHDPTVAERHLVVRRDGVSVTAFDVRLTEKREPPRELLPGKPLAIGRHHALQRVPDVSTETLSTSSRTEPILSLDRLPEDLSLVVGKGIDGGRCISLGARPLTVGASSECDVVLADRAVSAVHFRIAPTGAGFFVRDLGSRNGTFVDGVRTVVARVAAGTRIRVGRTDVFVVGRGQAGDARRAGMVAASPAMLQVLEKVERMAHQRWPALVLGESGVGKEGIARALHTRGPRAGGPFIAVNAGGLARDLVESELFGHEKGAFTGAAAVHRGVFEQASGGTLFLDEIGELSLELQARLLRVIETGEIRRVGGESLVPVDVRLVCATHRDLRARGRAGHFRLDLYYRIAQLVLAVPKLSERPEDIRALSAHFLEEVGKEVGPRQLSLDALDALLAHSWPGNARELRSVVRSAALEAASEVIEQDEVLLVIERLSGGKEPEEGNFGAVVERHRGNLSAAARALGVPRSTLRDRVRRTDPPGRGDGPRSYDDDED